MAKETIYEFRTKQLLEEYKLASEELLKKDCYVTGLRKTIEDQVQHYYDCFSGKWYKMYVEELGGGDVDVRIGKIKVDFYPDSLEIKVHLVIDPNAVNNSVECTEKEKKLLSQAKKLWKDDVRYSSVFNYYSLDEISGKLELLKNCTQIVKTKYYRFSKLELLTWADVCTEHMVLGVDSGDKQVLLGSPIHNI